MNLLAYFATVSSLKKKFYNIDTRSTPQRSPSNVSASSVVKSVSNNLSEEPNSESRRGRRNNEESEKSSAR